MTDRHSRLTTFFSLSPFPYSLPFSVNYGNPEITDGNGGWMIFNAILGWNNTATYGSVLSYVFYWIAIFVALVYQKWKEGRVAPFGLKSQALKDRGELSDRCIPLSLSSFAQLYQLRYM
jgi:hypothetical protein